MLRPNTDAYVGLPAKGNRRVLLPVRVLTVRNDACTAALAGPSPGFKPEQDLLLYYDIRAQFSQQPIRIDAIMERPDSTVIGFCTTGRPVSASGRECFRVSALAARLTATVGEQPGCPLIDISASGFSVTCSASYQIGQSVPVSLTHGGRTFSGLATVQSIRQLRPGRIRYGLYCGGRHRALGELEQGLTQISIDLQRAQLRRMAGA